MIAHSLTPTQIALHEARKARQARQARMAARVQSNDNAPVRVVHEPEWRRTATCFDAHVTDFRLYVAKFASPKRAFLIDRAKARGYTVSQVTMPSRVHKIVIARQDIMLEVAEKFPHMTLNEIGRLFGGYDHSTVRSALERAAMRRAGLISKVVVTRVRRTPLNRTPDAVREQVVSLYRAGNTQTDVAQMTGITRPTVRSILKESGDLHAIDRD